MEIKFDYTSRGFAIIEFKDEYNISCNIQKSSLASKDCIWIGCDVNDQQVKENYNIRMHLTQEQVKQLISILQHFADTGELPDKEME